MMEGYYKQARLDGKIIHHSEPKCYELTYIYGVPILVLDNLPHNSWSVFTEGLYVHGIGIFLVKSRLKVAIVEHEIVHSVIYWLSKDEVGIFRLPRIKVGRVSISQNRSLTHLHSTFSPLFIQCLEQVRNEGLAHLLVDISKSRLSEYDIYDTEQLNLLLISLAGHSNADLKKGLSSFEYEKICKLCNTIWRAAQEKLPFSSNELCKILLSEYELSRIVGRIQHASR